MRYSPYRTAAASEQVTAPRRTPMGNRDILPVFAALWLAGVIRLGLAFAHQETFGTELTLVLATVVLIPMLLLTSRFGRRSRAS